ncbi:hypothetical protein ACFQ5F_12220 [Kroppenstedtia eburnea]|uniref:hypothetical protein n=1 Tax=Kroppenstedtia eburnea TaxID=714067 RepID=UPI00363F8BCF
MQFLKEVWSIYWGHKKLIALVALFILTPLAVLNFFISFSFQYYFTFLFLPIGGDFMQSLFGLIFLSVMEIPFICLVLSVIRNEEVVFGRVVKGFFDHVVPIYFIGCLYGLMVSMGLVFLIIPGLLLLIFLALFPQALIMEDEKWFGGLRRSFIVVKDHFFPVMGILLLLFGVEMLLKTVLMGGALFLAQTYLPALLINLALHLTVFPLFTIWLSLLYVEWAGVEGDMGYNSEHIA